jgi:hypothetical protein
VPVTRDVAALTALLVAFALLVTIHVTLAVGLARRRSRRDALVALALPPLAPWWGWKEGMTLRSATWILAAAVYAITLLAQTHMATMMGPGSK